MLPKAYGECAFSKTQAYEWYTTFADGREVVQDLPRSVRPSTDENVGKVKEMVLENHHLSLIPSIGHEELNFFQKMHRKKMTEDEDILEQVNSDPNFIQRIITGDDTWLYEFDMQTSQEAAEWRYPNEPKPKKPRQSRSKVKVLLLVFFV